MGGKEEKTKCKIGITTESSLTNADVQAKPSDAHL